MKIPEELAREVALKDPEEWTDSDREILRWQYILTLTQKRAICAYLQTLSAGSARILADVDPAVGKNLN